jgi:hypothetical protein
VLPASDMPVLSPGMGRVISKRFVFETSYNTSYFSEEEGYRLVSKLVSKSKFQNLAYVMSFDTIVL